MASDQDKPSVDWTSGETVPSSKTFGYNSELDVHPNDHRFGVTEHGLILIEGFEKVAHVSRDNPKHPDVKEQEQREEFKEEHGYEPDMRSSAEKIHGKWCGLSAEEVVSWPDWEIHIVGELEIHEVDVPTKLKERGWNESTEWILDTIQGKTDASLRVVDGSTLHIIDAEMPFPIEVEYQLD